MNSISSASLRPGWTVIVHGSAGRAAVRTLESAARQTDGRAELFLVLPYDPAPAEAPVSSTAERLGVRIVSAATLADGLDTALERSAGERVLFVHAGYELHADACEVLAAALTQRGAALATGPISVESDDGMHAAPWTPRGRTVAETLSDPHSVPPVWAAVSSAIVPIRPFHTSTPLMEIADAWLTCLDAGCLPLVVDGPIARRAASAAGAWGSPDRLGDYAAAAERLLHKHRRLVDEHLEVLVIDSEVRFGELRDRHLALLARRDDSLAELDRLRAAAAHHRAFLAHHRLDRIDWGSLDRTDPVSRNWGYDRGGPVDRRYIRQFLAAHSSDVSGDVLEVQENDLTRRYGGPRVAHGDVLDVDAANPHATVVADLRLAPSIEPARYDCIILTQTAHVIDDLDAVLKECHRILKPGGALLATFPCLSRVCLEYGPADDFWRLTPAGAGVATRRTFGDVAVESFGNVQTGVAFMHGLGETELQPEHFDTTDPYNPILVGVRARRAAAARSRRSPRAPRGVVLLYHRVQSTGPGELDLNVSPELFRRHLDYLRSAWTVVSLESLLTTAPDDLPERAVALTFDDGYAHHLTDVAPVLAESDLPATYFVTSAGDRHWWDLLERCGAGMPAGERSEIHDRCVAATLEEREEIVADLRRRSSPEGLEMDADRRLLSAGEVRALATRPGVTIGAHGVHHLLLPRQTADVRETEMIECRRTIEAIIGKPVTLFAYPYGGVDDPCADAARAAFHWSVDCRPAAVPASFDAARVPRLDVKAWPADDLARRMDALLAPAASRPAISFLP